MGSEISDGVRNVFVESCTWTARTSTARCVSIERQARRRDRKRFYAQRRGRPRRRGRPDDRFSLRDRANGPHKPVVRNVTIENVRSASSPRVMWIAGFPGAVIEDIRFADCAFRGVEATEFVQNASSISFKNVTIEPAAKGRSRNSPETKLKMRTSTKIHEGARRLSLFLCVSSCGFVDVFRRRDALCLRRSSLVALLTVCATLAVVTLGQTEKPLMGSSVFDWNAIEATRRRSARREFFQAPTATLDSLNVT